jgi:hypothetical protein
MRSKTSHFFLTFIIAIVPFVILVYFGGALINYNAIAIQFDWPEVLPLSDLLPPVIVGATVFYIGQTVWLWWDWRKLRIARRGATDRAEYREGAGAVAEAVTKRTPAGSPSSPGSSLWLDSRMDG